MFSNLFFGLKQASVPISLREYLTLLEAMNKGVAMWDVEEFYFLARAALVKDERHIDKFDRVFQMFGFGTHRVTTMFLPGRTLAKCDRTHRFGVYV